MQAGKISGLFLIVTLFLSSPFAFASSKVSHCKGQLQKQCDNDKACTWVQGYITKKGKKIKSYCRSSTKNTQANKKGNKQAKTLQGNSDKRLDKGKRSLSGKGVKLKSEQKKTISNK